MIINMIYRQNDMYAICRVQIETGRQIIVRKMQAFLKTQITIKNFKVNFIISNLNVSQIFGKLSFLSEFTVNKW